MIICGHLYFEWIGRMRKWRVLGRWREPISAWLWHHGIEVYHKDEKSNGAW